jgi:hypothetical protein
MSVFSKNVVCDFTSFVCIHLLQARVYSWEVNEHYRFYSACRYKSLFLSADLRIHKAM